MELDANKEITPYNVCTYGNASMGACSIQSASDILKDDDKQQLLDNLEQWDCILGKGMYNQMSDLIKYSSIYCKMGCKVLMDGCEVLRQWMLEHTELDVQLYYNTIYGFIIYVETRCYDNVYQISGVIHQFITKCVVGGRVMTNPNKQYHVKQKTADFDACY